MKKLFVTMAAALLLLAACAPKDNSSLPRGKATAALIETFEAWLQAEADAGQTIHSAMLLKNGKVVAERWMDPASPDSAHAMYSVSKTFTAMAVGLAISEGRLSLTDRLVEFFPDRLPDQMSANMAAVTVRDLLTMSCGQAQEHTDEIRYGASDDWVAEFFKYPVEYKPGTHFCYNTIGTYMLSAIVTAVTGEKIVDYLQPRLWEPLGIEKPCWKECPKGINFGGWGLFLKTEDMAKAGQMLLDKGKWHGRQILPSEWVEEMTKCQVDNRPEYLTPNNDTRPDWHRGYCYQMWRCRHGAFRADGAFGQYIIVMPVQNAVLAVTADVGDMQTELSLIWDYLLLL